VNARVKEIRDAKRKGKDPKPEEFQPVPILRSRAEILQELEQSKLVKELTTGITQPNDAFKMALKWVLNLDPKSAELQKVKDEERKAERKRQQEATKVERTRKRAEDAAKKAQELKAEAEKLEKEEAAAKA
jgi:cobalamin-dependent methionine synthase I